MHLKGSCHCGAVTFSLDSPHPVPYNICYCSICRKTAGGGGFAINLGGLYETLAVTGTTHVGVYQATIDGEVSPARRSFCSRCASTLWVWDPRWPSLVHPFASAIDTPLPQAPEQTHLMLASKAKWVRSCVGENDLCFDGYPDESLAQWHERMGLEQ